MKNIPLYKVYEVNTFKDIIKKRVELFPNKPVFMYKKAKGEPYTSVLPKEYAEDIDALGTGLSTLLKSGARVAILSETRYEWYVSYMAITNGIGCVVPLDKELKANELSAMLERAEVEAIIFSSKKKEIIDEIKGQVSTLKNFICMDSIEDEEFIFWQELKEKGAKLVSEGNREFIDAVIDPEKMSVLLFTSGTTSKSKAVMLNQKNICANVMMMFEYVNFSEEDIFLSVLPLHHTYECTCGFIAQVYRGTTVAVCEGLRYISANMKEVKPTCILMVPAMLQMFYKSIQKKLNSDPKVLAKFKKGVKLSNFLLKFNIDIRKKLFKEIHDNFGGNLRLLVLGGAPIDPDILKFFQDIGILAIQGYGLTECSPILALNRDVDYKNNSAGIPVTQMEVKVDNPDSDGIGEFLAKGPSVFMGYYGDQEATDAVIDKDGYYHTGDLGYIDKDGFVIITGRKKNVIIAKNGKNVFPEEIEYLLSLNPIVCESIVSGVYDEHKDDIIIVGTIYPDKELIKAKLGDNPSDEEIQKLLEQAVSVVNEKLVNYKKIKRVVYRPTEFEKNTSKKIKRY